MVGQVGVQPVPAICGFVVPGGLIPQVGHLPTIGLERKPVPQRGEPVIHGNFGQRGREVCRRHQVCQFLTHGGKAGGGQFGYGLGAGAGSGSGDQIAVGRWEVREQAHC